MELQKLIHYRYERKYSLHGSKTVIELVEFKTLRKTYSGYWIQEMGYSWRKEIFVLKESRKRYAYPTKKEAFNSFRIRTKKSLAYAERDFDNSRLFLELIKQHDLNK